MNQTSPLEKDIITQPELWELRLFLSDSSLWVALVPPVDSETLIVRSFVIDKDNPSPQKTIENILFSNPLLFSDFKSVTCYISSREQIAVPAETPANMHAELMEDAFPTLRNDIIATSLGDNMPVMLTSINSDLKGFLNRTFYNIKFKSHFLPLYNVACCQSVSNTQILAFITTDSVDVLAIAHSNLLLANSFSTSNPETAAYYILATRRILGLETLNCPIITAGYQSQLSSLNNYLAKTGAVVRSLSIPQLPFLLPQQSFPLQLL